MFQTSNCTSSGGVLYKQLTVFHRASYEESSRWNDMYDHSYRVTCCVRLFGLSHIWTSLLSVSSLTLKSVFTFVPCVLILSKFYLFTNWCT